MYKVCISLNYIITGPPTHSVRGGQYCFARWRWSTSVVVVCNTPRRAWRWLHPCRPGMSCASSVIIAPR